MPSKTSANQRLRRARKAGRLAATLAGQIQVHAAIVNEQLWVLSQSRLPSRVGPAVALLLDIVDEFLTRWISCPLPSSEASGAVFSCQSHLAIQRTDKGSVKLLCVFISIIFQHSPSRGEALFFPIDLLRTPVTCINHDETLTYFIIYSSRIPRDSCGRSNPLIGTWYTSHLQGVQWSRQSIKFNNAPYFRKIFPMHQKP